MHLKATHIGAGPPRGLWEPWANINVGPIGEGGLGARPQEILRFYMLSSVFWGLLRLLFEHAYST